MSWRDLIPTMLRPKPPVAPAPRIACVFWYSLTLQCRVRRSVFEDLFLESQQGEAWKGPNTSTPSRRDWEDQTLALPRPVHAPDDLPVWFALDRVKPGSTFRCSEINRGAVPCSDTCTIAFRDGHSLVLVGSTMAGYLAGFADCERDAEAWTIYGSTAKLHGLQIAAGDGAVRS